MAHVSSLHLLHGLMQQRAIKPAGELQQHQSEPTRSLTLNYVMSLQAVRQPSSQISLSIYFTLALLISGKAAAGRMLKIVLIFPSSIIIIMPICFNWQNLLHCYCWGEWQRRRVRMIKWWGRRWSDVWRWTIVGSSSKCATALLH